MGQLGVIGVPFSSVPVKPTDSQRPLSMAGWDYSCGIGATTPRYVCAGNNAKGQLGDGTRINRPTPVPMAALAGRDLTSSELALGFEHTCVWLWATEELLCVGSSEWDELGIGTETNDRFVASFAEPQSVSLNLSDLALGDGVTFFVKADGLVRAWGKNLFGNLGDGTQQQVTMPAVVPLACP